MNLFKTVNDESLRLMLESELTDLEEKVQEWRNIKKQQAVLASVVKMMTSRIDELEGELLPYVKEIDGQQVVIDTAIVEYKTRSTTGVKYEAAFRKALEISNKKQREVLNTFLATVTTSGVKERVAIADPDLEEFLVTLGNVTPDELSDRLGDVSKLPRNLINKKKRDGEITEGVKDTAAAAIKKLVSLMKTATLALKAKLSASKSAADKLMAAAKVGAVKEEVSDLDSIFDK